MGLRNAISSVGSFLRPNSLSVPVSAALLSRAVAKATEGDANISEIAIVFGDARFEVIATVKKSVVSVQAKSSFAIESLEITQANQFVRLKRLGNPSVQGIGWFSRLAIALFHGFFVQIMRQDVLQLALRRQPGISFESDVIVVDLAAMGVKSALLEAVYQQAQQYVDPVASVATALTGSFAPLARVCSAGIAPLARAGASKIIDKIEVVGAKCTPEGLVLDARFASATVAAAEVSTHDFETSIK